jgi:hypothetical protein
VRHFTRQQVSARGNLDGQHGVLALDSFGMPLDDFLPGAKKWPGSELLMTK